MNMKSAKPMWLLLEICLDSSCLASCNLDALCQIAKELVNADVCPDMRLMDIEINATCHVIIAFSVFALVKSLFLQVRIE